MSLSRNLDVFPELRAGPDRRRARSLAPSACGHNRDPWAIRIENNSITIRRGEQYQEDPWALRIENTFIRVGPRRSPSLDRFHTERRERSCPSIPMRQIAEKDVSVRGLKGNGCSDGCAGVTGEGRRCCSCGDEFGGHQDNFLACRICCVGGERAPGMPQISLDIRGDSVDMVLFTPTPTTGSPTGTPREFPKYSDFVAHPHTSIADFGVTEDTDNPYVANSSEIVAFTPPSSNGSPTGTPREFLKHNVADLGLSDTAPRVECRSQKAEGEDARRLGGPIVRETRLKNKKISFTSCVSTSTDDLEETSVGTAFQRFCQWCPVVPPALHLRFSFLAAFVALALTLTAAMHQNWRASTAPVAAMPVCLNAPDAIYQEAQVNPATNVFLPSYEFQPSYAALQRSVSTLQVVQTSQSGRIDRPVSTDVVASLESLRGLSSPLQITRDGMPQNSVARSTAAPGFANWLDRDAATLEYRMRNAFSDIMDLNRRYETIIQPKVYKLRDADLAHEILRRGRQFDESLANLQHQGSQVQWDSDGNIAINELAGSRKDAVVSKYWQYVVELETFVQAQDYFLAEVEKALQRDQLS